MSNFEIRAIRVPRWALVLTLAIVVALGLTLAVVAAGLFLIVFPVAFVLAGIAALLGSFRSRRVMRRDVRVIDADYVVHHEPFGRQDRR